MNMFRTLRADEIDCRVAQIKPGGLTLLLYKDARCDQNILDETVGAFGWMRSHSRDNANCTVSLWDEKKQQWISKEDVGTESNTESVKGLASDSFKRACFNWGIGRELYTAPFIFIPSSKCNIKAGERGERPKCSDKFIVQDIRYREDGARDICALTIYNATTRAVCFTWTDSTPRYTEPEAAPEPAKAPAQVKRDAPATVSRSNTMEELKRFGETNNLTNEALKRWKGLAIKAGMIPEKPWTEYTFDEIKTLETFIVKTNVEE